jgi:hypothetical protein
MPILPYFAVGTERLNSLAREVLSTPGGVLKILSTPGGVLKFSARR